MTQHIPAIITTLQPFISQYGYYGLGSLLLLESFGIPLPGETTLIASAVFAGLGQLNIVVVILVALIACVIGDNFAYVVGRLGGARLIEKYGKYIFLDKAKYAKVEAFFNKRGGLVVAGARFFEGLRQLNGIVAGSIQMKWHKFILFNVIGAVLWVSAWTSVGYYGGNHITTLLKFQSYLSILVVLAIILFIIRQVYKKRSHK